MTRIRFALVACCCLLACAAAPASAADGAGSAGRKHHHRHARAATHATHAVHSVGAVRTAPDQPALSSGSALVVDETTAAVLVAKHADVTAPIASITKLMTALVVLDAAQSMDETLEITRDDQNLDKPTTSRLTVGTRLTRADLMHLALMSSENRAAHALGRNYPGGLAACIAAMNAKAAELGMASSHFVEPTGLSSENVSSPQDLTRLVIAASHNTTIQAYSTDSRYFVPVGRHMEEFRNTDKLVAASDWNIIVQKTGYIAEAGKCLVMKAIIEGRAVVIVLLDSIGKETRLADARRIKKWMEARLSAAAGHLVPPKA